ncbi:PTS sugar transporter subunit IIB [Clostridium hydrogenum]|uniref:PTS sugar transporter subunit IIB n=1 Tax=Clostridium hydrogenum TaxID=2855764 RepID=UPI001F15A0E8|nr:PTS sugar transporter subunit IIB [Clostridium hydrogenum]
MKILLFCSAGMSTSMLVTKMKKAAAEEKIEADIDALPQAQMINHANDADVVLLGPQIKFMLPKAKGIFDPKGIPVEVINSADYGMLNGKKVLHQALKLAEK